MGSVLGLCYSSLALGQLSPLLRERTLSPAFLLICFFAHSIHKQNSISCNSLSKSLSPFLLVCSHPVLSFPLSLLSILHTSSSAIYLDRNLTSSLCIPSQPWSSFSSPLCAFLAPHSNSGASYCLTTFFFFSLENGKIPIPIPSVISEKELSNLNCGHCYQ